MAITAPLTLPDHRPVYGQPAPEMRETMRIMLAAFLLKQPDFAGLNPALFGGTDFADGMKLALEGATSVADYDSRVAVGSTAAITEQDALAACRPHCQSLFYFVRRAWPATANKGVATARLKEFGQDKYADAFDKPTEMAALMEQANVAYSLHTPALTAAGWLANPHHQAFVAARQTLINAGAQKGVQSGLNAEETARYYRANNGLYWFGQQLAEAADLLYATDPAQEKPFQLGASGPERYSFTLKPGQRKARHLNGLLSPSRELRFRVEGPDADPKDPQRAIWADFLPGEDSPMEYRVTLRPTAKRQTQKVKAGDLGDAGPWIGIENLTDEEVTVVVTIAE